MAPFFACIRGAVLGAILCASPAAAQGPAWTVPFDTPATGALGAFTHAAPDGDGGLFALSATTGSPHGLDLRVVRIEGDGRRAWVRSLPGDAGRDEVPLAFDVAGAGPCVVYATFAGPDRVARAVCTDPAGAIRWQADVPGVNLGLDSFGPRGTLAMGATPDGGVVVAAASTENPGHLVVIRLGPTGGEMWRTTLEPPDGPVGTVEAHATADGGAIIALPGARVLRLDATGAVAWSRSPAGPAGAFPYLPTTLVVGPAGDVLVRGWEQGSKLPTPVVARYSPTGDLQWRTSPYDDLSIVAAFGEAGESLHADGYGRRLVVTALDSAGVRLWAASHDLAGYRIADLAAVLPDAAGVILVGTGVRTVGEGETRAPFAVALDATGALRWENVREPAAGPGFAMAGVHLGGDRVGVVGASSTADGIVPEAAIVEAGATVAEKVFPASPRPLSTVAALRRAPGGVLALGRRPDEDGLYRLMLTRLSDTGQERWARPAPGFTDIAGHRVSVDAAGSAVVAGRVRDEGYQYDARIVRFDADGDIVWEASHAGPGGRDDSPQAVFAGPGGTALLVLIESGPSGGSEALVIGYGPDGSVAWTDRLATPTSAYTRTLTADRLGDGLVVAATIVETLVVRAYGPDGAVRWTYEGTGLHRDITATPAGGVCFTGDTTGCVGPDGTLSWEAAVPGTWVVVGPDGTVTIARPPPGDGSRDPAPARLVRFSAGGALLWDIALDNDLGHGPGYASLGEVHDAGDGLVFVSTTSDTRLYVDHAVMLIGREGEERWRTPQTDAEAGGVARSRPALALGPDRQLYVGTTVGELQTFASHPSPLYRTNSYLVAEVARFDAGVLPYSVAVASGPVAGARLWPPAPNPFAWRATIRLTVESPVGEVTVDLVDALGRRVGVLHDGPLAGGTHAFEIDGARLPPGTYLVRAILDGVAETRPVTLVR